MVNGEWSIVNMYLSTKDYLGLLKASQQRATNKKKLKNLLNPSQLATYPHLFGTMFGFT